MAVVPYPSASDPSAIAVAFPSPLPGQLASRVDSNDKSLKDSKADKVIGVVAGDVATLDANGNLLDSGISSSVVLTVPLNAGGGNAVQPGSNSGAIGTNCVSGYGFAKISSINGDTVTLVSPGFSAIPSVRDNLMFTDQAGHVIKTAVASATSSTVFTVATGSLSGMTVGYICDYTLNASPDYACLALGDGSVAVGGGGYEGMPLPSVAMSSGTADGAASVAIGPGCISSGRYSCTIGKDNAASGAYSFATCGVNAAAGPYAVSTGFLCIASGNYSFAAGRSSRGEADCAAAFGQGCYAGGAYSFAMGYEAYALGKAAFAGGGSSTISEGVYGFAFGSAAYTHANSRNAVAFGGGMAWGDCSFAMGSAGFGVADGGAYAGGAYSFAFGTGAGGGPEGGTQAWSEGTFGFGYASIAAWPYSMAFGKSSQSYGSYSSAFGNQCHAALYGQASRASGAFSSFDAQISTFTLRNSTATATATNLYLDGISAVMAFSPSTSVMQTTWGFKVTVAAYDQTDNYAGRWKIEGCIKLDNNRTVTLVGTPTVSSWVDSGFTASATVLADNTVKALQVQVTGVASKTIRWLARAELEQVTFTVNF